MAKVKISLFLLRKDLDDDKDVFKEQATVLQRYSDEKIAYYVPSMPTTPKWVKNFFGESTENPLLLQSSPKAVLWIKRNYGDESRAFVVTFGHGRYLLKDGVIEERFGIKTVLNSVESSSLRKLSKTCIGSNHKQSNEQIPKSGGISEFGLDVERDLVNGVTAQSSSDIFEKAILTGTDMLSVTVDCTVDDVETFADNCYSQYTKRNYSQNFPWLDKIEDVRDKNQISALDEKVLECIMAEEFEKVWMAVPEVIEWSQIKSFKYGFNSEADDIYIEEVIGAKRDATELTIEYLKGKEISAISAIDDSQIAYHWKAYNCLVAELDVNGKTYCLSNGKWYLIDTDFVEQVNREYSLIAVAEIDCCSYPTNNNEKQFEAAYNEALSEHIDGSALLDAKCIMHGGGSSKIEICDVLTPDKELIHVKKLSGSAPLSHLFSQGIVSAESLRDSQFRDKCWDLYAQNGYDDLIDEPFNPSNYTVVYAIISKDDGSSRPTVPFFARVSARHAATTIKNLGYKDVQLLKIKNTY